MPRHNGMIVAVGKHLFWRLHPLGSAEFPKQVRIHPVFGGLAQLGERYVRNVEAYIPIPFPSPKCGLGEIKNRVNPKQKGQYKGSVFEEGKSCKLPRTLMGFDGCKFKVQLTNSRTNVQNI